MFTIRLRLWRNRLVSYLYFDLNYYVSHFNGIIYFVYKSEVKVKGFTSHLQIGFTMFITLFLTSGIWYLVHGVYLIIAHLHTGNMVLVSFV